MGHECKIETLWSMERRELFEGCLTCVIGGRPWPAWAQTFSLSREKIAIIEAAIALGIEVDTDGTETVIVNGGEWKPWWVSAALRDKVKNDGQDLHFM